jgi:predicted O-methyltransferase YrrM
MIRRVVYDALVPWHRAHALRRLRWLERRLPDPAVRFAVPFVFRGRGHFRIRIVQEPREILALYRAACAARPRCVVEIGTALGGTLYLWAQAAADDALVVSIDLPGGPFGGGYPACREPLYRAFARPGQELRLVRGDARAATTAAHVAALLAGRPIDFLFVDADHTYDGVLSNVRQYGPRVRAGGAIAFHDIRPNPRDPRIEVHRLWDHLRRVGDVTEWVFPDAAGRAPGIGLLRVPAGGVEALLPP